MKGKGPCKATAFKAADQTKDRVQEQWLLSALLIGGLALLSLALRAGSTLQGQDWDAGRPGQPAAAQPSYLCSMELPFSFTQLFLSPESWDWGWKGVVGGRKLAENHKLGLGRAFLSSSGISCSASLRWVQGEDNRMTGPDMSEHSKTGNLLLE